MNILAKPLTALVLLAGMGLASTAEAELIDRGFAVYDKDLNISWLKDANANGTMTWQAAKDWAAGLNVGGFTGWRLPTADPTCGFSFDCINSELGHLYYTEGGLKLNSNITDSAVLSNLFTNMQNYVYWSGTELAPNNINAWVFRTDTGFQGLNDKGVNIIFAWAVRSGDVAAVPEPEVMGLLGVGALAWAGTKARRRG